MILPSIGAPVVVIALGFLGVLLATIQDLKTREVPDSLSSGLIVLGFALALLRVVFGGPIGIVLNAVLGFAFGYGAGALLYYSKQWGGGDAKLLAGIGALFGFFADPALLSFGFTRSSGIVSLVVLAVSAGLAYLSRHEGRRSWVPVLATGSLLAAVALFTDFGVLGVHDLLLPAYLLVVFLAGALWGVIMLLWLGWTHRSALRFGAAERLRIYGGYAVGIALIVTVEALRVPLSSILVVLAGLIGVMPLLVVVTRQLEGRVFRRVAEPRELVPGDWLAEDLVDTKGRVVIAKTNPGLSEEQIERISKLWKAKKLREITIKDGIAFVPAFLIALVVLIVL